MAKGEPVVVDLKLRHATAGMPRIRAASVSAVKDGSKRVVVGIGGIMVYLTRQQAFDLGLSLAGALGGRFLLGEPKDG